MAKRKVQDSHLNAAPEDVSHKRKKTFEQKAPKKRGRLQEAPVVCRPHSHMCSGIY
jgi:hypothetical protein